MYLHRIVITLIFAVSISSCVFVAETSGKQKYADNCNMFTKQLVLSAQEIKGQLCDQDDSAEVCLMIYGVILPVSSFVISGSIVLIGNTLHWLEYQGPCNESNA